MAFQAQTFPLKGNGSFLRVNTSSCLLRIGEKTYHPSEGPIVNPGEKGTFSCAVSNPGTTRIEALADTEYAVRSVSGSNKNGISQIERPTKLSFEPGSTQEVSFEIPSVAKPQSYEGYAYLTDSSKSRLTPMMSFKWTVPGESATILSLNSDKAAYSNGDTAKITVNADASADLTWRHMSLDIGSNSAQLGQRGTSIDNSKLKVTLLNSMGLQCGTNTINLPSTKEDAFWPMQEVPVNITRDCPNFKLEAQIIHNDQVLASSERSYGVEVKEDQTSDSSATNTIMIIAVSALLLLIAAVSYFFWKKRKTTPPTKPGVGGGTDTATSTAARSVAVIIMALTIFALGTGRVSADTIKSPVDEPINSKTVTGQDYRGTFWTNISSFYEASSSASSQGKSTVTTNADCSVTDVFLHGYADFAQCSNFNPGFRAKIFIDGKPANILSLSTPGNSSESRGGGVFDVYGEPGLKTARASLAVPAEASAAGIHNVEVHVAALGRHYISNNEQGDFYDSDNNLIKGGNIGRVQYEIRHTFGTVRDVKPCGIDEPCYIKMSAQYTCNKCPAGQNKPHFVCDPTTKACKEINECGVTTCTPGQNNCENCDNPNELKPHKACVNNSCTTIEACGAPSCNSTADCCPAGQMYNPETGQCGPPPACNVSCTSDTYCQNAQDGCTSCLPSDTGTGSVCRPPAACNVACANDNQCSKAVDGCTACVDGACKVPPACGSACTTKAECGGAKDGCTECLEGSCTDYADSMCKCDGMVAEMNYPNNFNFEAFGKVEGADTSKAEIADITFRMTKDNQVVAKSNPITPEIVENSGTKTRFKAAWQTAPPAVSANSTYRVFADVRCKPKRIVADASVANTSSLASKDLSPQTPKPFTPKGLALITTGVKQLFGGNNTFVNSQAEKLLTLLSVSSASAQGSNLQLQTLNFVKLMDTDNCRFVMFKYDESLF